MLSERGAERLHIAAELTRLAAVSLEADVENNVDSPAWEDAALLSLYTRELCAIVERLRTMRERLSGEHGGDTVAAVYTDQ